MALPEPISHFSCAGRWRNSLTTYIAAGVTTTDVPVASRVAKPVILLKGGEDFQVQPERARQWASTVGFKANPGEMACVPDAQGGVSSILLGVDADDLWSFAVLPGKLPPGHVYAYELGPFSNGSDGGAMAERALLGWALGTYSYKLYKTVSNPASLPPLLVPPTVPDLMRLEATVDAIFWVRDMITTPAEDLGPQHLAAEAEALAQAHGAVFSTTAGDDLLAANYPAIHTVGRASSRAPMLLDIQWAPKNAAELHLSGNDLPLLVLCGKGVCFDSGGLNIKTAAGMRLMKKLVVGRAAVRVGWAASLSREDGRPRVGPYRT